MKMSMHIVAVAVFSIAVLLAASPAAAGDIRILCGARLQF
jgi:hypothetical protein